METNSIVAFISGKDTQSKPLRDIVITVNISYLSKQFYNTFSKYQWELTQDKYACVCISVPKGGIQMRY